MLLLVGVLFLASLSGDAAAAAEESPHWDKSACDTCHNSLVPADSSDVRLDDHNELCADCHDESAASSCPHPTDLPAQDLEQFSLPEPYRSALDDDQIVCTTCHAINLQCTGGRRAQYENSSFLRNGPSRQGQACFDCHDTEGYEKLNPHRLSADSGTETCLFCHNEAPDQELVSHAGFRLGDDLQCAGCHRVLPHPLSAPGASSDEWTHLVVPTPDIRTRMRAAEDRTGVALPLDPDDGAINCTTCHNVHDPGRTDYPLRSDDSAPNKLRMLDICEACHDK